MNKKNKLFIVLVLCIIYGSKLFADGSVTYFKDPLEVKYITNSGRKANVVVQKKLMEQSAWNNFVKENSSWKVIFDENSAMPHRAYGKPLAVQGNSARNVAENFIGNQLASFRIPVNDLQFVSVSSNEKCQYVTYIQNYQGLEVLFSKVQVRMTHAYLVNQMILDCFNNIQLSTIPVINASAASHLAQQDISGVQNITVNPELKVLPVPGNGVYAFHLVHEVTVENLNANGVPAKYYTLVDAHDGKILYRTNMVQHVANTDINFNGTLYLTHPYNPSTVEPIKNLRIVESGTIYFSDDNGYIGLTNTSATSATVSLQGKWVKIRTNNVTPTWVVNLSPGANNILIDSNTDIKQRTTYNAINTVHDYMKTKYPVFTGLDNPTIANIDVVGECNAFYSGSSVNFFDLGGGCNPSSLVVDVCYHEYGHAINDKFYQSQGFSFNNGAMNEGYADIWALGITGDPVLGIGFYSSNPSGYIRRYDINKKVYPQDLVGEVHADGEIIAGCFWDTGLNLGNLQQMIDLFKETFYAGVTGPNGNEGAIYQDILFETLAQDDNDGDITNGTPNYCAIVAAFEIHGITLGTAPLLCSPVSIFTCLPSEICEGTNVTFEDNSFFASSWSWDFPGGTPSTSVDQNPIVTYNTAGVYDATLTVTNATGTDSHTETMMVTVLPTFGQTAIPFYESFESINFPGTDWTVENQGGNGWVQNTVAAKTGTNSVYIDNSSGNLSGTTDVFITPSYNLTGSISNFMTFELAYAIQDSSSVDGLKVFVSTTCGQFWNIRYTKYGVNLATAGIVTTPFVPTANEWVTQSVNLSSVAYNNKPNVRFKFEYYHESGNNIFIDDINIAGLVGVNELPAESMNFAVYPNPVSSVATVSFNLEAGCNVYVDVLDNLGRNVNTVAETFLEQGEYQFELPATLANGLYNVRIIAGGNTLSKKVLINR